MLWGNLGSKNKKPQAALQLFNNSWESQSVLVTLPMNWEDSLLHLWGGTAQLLYSSQKCYQKIRKWMRKHSFPTESFMMQQEFQQTELTWFPRLTKTITCQKKPQKQPNLHILCHQDPKLQTTQSTTKLLSTSSNSAHLTEPVWESSDTSTDSYSTSPVVMAAFFHPRNGLVWPYLA